jgi:predicted NACHT family NTPase
LLQKYVDLKLEELRKDCQEARFAAAAAASLHEFAKETFEVWKTSGVFARRRALRDLRERAGFRLESHRIGNYVAKTFDLMNEADARFAKVQQRLFAADVSYKIRPGVYGSIAAILSR